MKHPYNSTKALLILLTVLSSFCAIAQQRTAGLDSPLYGVYRFSPKTVAAVVQLSPKEAGTTFDSIFYALAETDTLNFEWDEKKGYTFRNCSFYDTLGPLGVLKSKKLEAKIKPHFDVLYVYGTKGITQSKIKEVAFLNDECYGTYLLLVLQQFDTLKYGQPMFSSNTKMNLDYSGSFPKEEVIIENYERLANGGYLDEDSEPYGQFIPRTIYAHNGQVFFTYNDNFTWHKIRTTQFYFPMRSIYRLDGKKVTQLWFDLVDLYGIPCD